MGAVDSLDDGSLVRRARDGDSRAFGLLVDRYMRPTYSIAFSVTKNHADAEDAVQESFVVALERLDECRKPESFGSWLFTIVRNRSRNLIRRESVRETDPIPVSAATDRPGPHGHLEREELRGLLEDAVAGLSGVRREVLLLHDLEGWKHREIAERLEMPPGTVRSHLHHARKAVRKTLGPILDPAAKEDVS